MYKFFEHLKDCYYEIKAMSFKSRLNFDLSFWKYLFLRGLTVSRSSWNFQKLKKLKVDLGKVEFVRSWKSEKLKIAWVENAKVEKFQSWKCKCWICEKLQLQKLKRQGWKCKVENAEVEPSRSHICYLDTWGANSLLYVCWRYKTFLYVIYLKTAYNDCVKPYPIYKTT